MFADRSHSRLARSRAPRCDRERSGQPVHRHIASVLLIGSLFSASGGCARADEVSPDSPSSEREGVVIVDGTPVEQNFPEGQGRIIEEGPLGPLVAVTGDLVSSVGEEAVLGLSSATVACEDGSELAPEDLVVGMNIRFEIVGVLQSSPAIASTRSVTVTGECPEDHADW